MSPAGRLSRLPHPRSPRGRLLLATAVGLVAVLVAVAVVLVGHSPQAPAATIPQDRPGPVVLVPGYGGGTDSLDVLATRLSAAGHRTTVLRLLGDGTGDLVAQAQALRTAVDGLLAAGAPSVDVVGFSAGGVVARIWATDLGGAAHARRVVLLGSPNHGTQLAALGSAFGGSLCGVACQQLVPDSPLLAGLDEAGTPGGPQWVSIWTTNDQVVTPPESARLDGATNLTVQSVCSDQQVEHGDLPRDPVVQALVTRALAVAAFEAPPSSQCAALRSP